VAHADDEKPRTRLYLISPENIPDLKAFAKTLDAALGAGDVACFQLRLKGANEEAIAEAVQALMPIAHEHDVAFILNDLPGLAATLQCDGVHVGHEDMPYDKARNLVGADATVGVTCKDSRHLAMELAEAGADYVAFGAFFPSSTKANTTPCDLEIIEIWSETTNVPCVAIGGITVENCRPLVEAGADFIAAGGGVWNHPEGPPAAVLAFNEIFDDVYEGRGA
jgi:thiamine-phosphate pyrophosphorylase